MLAMGVLSSWVTALRKESCRSLRRISRMRKTVLRTTKAMSAAKRMTPRTAMARVRLFRTIQVMLRVTARPTVRTPRVMKVAMAPRRRVMFMLHENITGESLGWVRAWFVESDVLGEVAVRVLDKVRWSLENRGVAGRGASGG